PEPHVSALSRTTRGTDGGPGEENPPGPPSVHRWCHTRVLGAPWHFLYFLPEPHGQGALRGVPAYSGSLLSVCFSTPPPSLGPVYCNCAGFSVPPSPGTTTSGSFFSPSASAFSAFSFSASGASPAAGASAAAESSAPPSSDFSESGVTTGIAEAVAAADAAVIPPACGWLTRTSTLNRTRTDSSLMPSSISWNMS